MIESAFPRCRVHVIETSVLMKELGWNVQAIVESTAAEVVVSTLPFMARTFGGCTLSINRLFSRDGTQIGYGPRPGFDSLDIQFDRLALQVKEKPILLVEDGAYTGGTIRFILRELARRGLGASRVVIGFCGEKTEAVISRDFGGDLIVLNRIRNLIDWVAVRDMVPFAPHCGRVLGRLGPDGCMPILGEGGVGFAYPYVLPFGRLEDWATMRPVEAQKFSRFFLGESIRLFKCIARLNGFQALSVRDLVGGQSKVSLPLTVADREGPPSLDDDVVRYLQDKLSSIG